MDNLNERNSIESASEESVKAEVGEETVEAPVTDADAAVDIVDNQVDYAEILANDIRELKTQFPELGAITDITELENPMRYAALRDLGLSAEEAYLATSKNRILDTRSHLKSAYGKRATADTGMMSQSELAIARELFPGRSDVEIQRLYKRVTK